MNYISLHPDQLQTYQKEQASELTADSFGRDNDAEMYEDTMNHIASADSVQLAIHESKLVGLSMLRSCLWRTSP